MEDHLGLPWKIIWNIEELQTVTTDRKRCYPMTTPDHAYHPASDEDAARQALDAIAIGEPTIPWADVQTRLDVAGGTPT